MYIYIYQFIEACHHGIMCIINCIYIYTYFIRMNILSCTNQTWKPNLNHVILQGVLDSNHGENCWCIYLYIYIKKYTYIIKHTYIDLYMVILNVTWWLCCEKDSTVKKSWVHLSNCQRSRHIRKLSLLHDLYELNGPWQMPGASLWFESATWVGQRSRMDFSSSKMKKHVPWKRGHF